VCPWDPLPELNIFSPVRKVSPTLRMERERERWGIRSAGGGYMRMDDGEGPKPL